MTTIVVNKEAMACDTQTNMGHLKFKANGKIIRWKGELIGQCGTVIAINQWLKWYKSKNRGEKNYPKTEEDFAMLVLKPNGDIYHWSNGDLEGLKIEEAFFSAGTGSEFALGAMSMGATLEQAIAVASKWDKNTGMGMHLETL